jgi:hypothetical protein
MEIEERYEQRVDVIGITEGGDIYISLPEQSDSVFVIEPQEVDELLTADMQNELYNLAASPRGYSDPYHIQIEDGVMSVF